VLNNTKCQQQATSHVGDTFCIARGKRRAELKLELATVERQQTAACLWAKSVGQEKWSNRSGVIAWLQVWHCAGIGGDEEREEVNKITGS
jgi:hypothetical protein